MKSKQIVGIGVLAVATALGLAACAALAGGPIGNRAVPQPAKPVELDRYLGAWHEIGRYENRFERDCEQVTAEYVLADDGGLIVINRCRKGGRSKVATGRAKVVPGSANTKLKVSFFGPFSGDYWVLDHADDYSWSIVGEPSGRYLWLLTRSPDPPAAMRATISARVRELGYDAGLIRPTQQSPDSGSPSPGL